MAARMELQAFYQLLNQEEKVPPVETGHFNIFAIEHLLLPQHKPVSYSRRTFFKISLVKGHSKIHYADQCIEVKENALVFTHPLIPYHWELVDKKQTGYVCIFTEAFFNRHAAIKDYPAFQHTAAAVIPLSPADTRRFEALFVKMQTELNSSYLYKYDLLRHILMEVVHEAQKLQPATGTPNSGANAAERIAGLFMDLLERQFPIEADNQLLQLHTPADFAQQLHIHINHLNKALKEITGKTTSQLINERLLQEAKILLKSTHWSVNEIAWCLRFKEPNHFSSFFKKQAGITPKQFRHSPAD